MRNFILLIVLLFGYILSFGQLNFSPNPVEVYADAKANENIQTDFEIKNTGPDTVLIAWKLDVIAQPTEWQNYVCDTEICYSFDQKESSLERPNVILPNSSIIVMFHTLPAEIEGVGNYEIDFFDVKEPNNILLHVPISVNTLTTSTNNIGLKGLSVFPNPATDFFRVNTGDRIKTIDLLTVVGKKVNSFKAEQGKYYNISNLNSGVYLVRLLDDKGEIVKVIKLRKM